MIFWVRVLSRATSLGDRQCEGSRLPPSQAQAGGLDQQSSMSLDVAGCTVAKPLLELEV